MMEINSPVVLFVVLFVTVNNFYLLYWYIWCGHILWYNVYSSLFQYNIVRVKSLQIDFDLVYAIYVYIETTPLTCVCMSLVFWKHFRIQLNWQETFY